jgi:hypothetical protein
MSTLADPAIFDFRLPMTNCVKQTSDSRLPIAPEFRLSTEASKWKATVSSVTSEN